MRTGRKRRVALWSFVALLLLVALAIAVWQVSRARCFVLTADILCRVETERPLVALTFDDGPTEQGVDAALADNGARATFFLIGEQVAERPHLVGRIAAARHEIGNHSLTRQQMVGRSSAFFDREIAETHRLLVAAGAPLPTLFRPPYGKKLWGLPAAAKRHGYKMVMIGVEEPTTTHPPPRAYADRLVGEAKPGSILLIHLMYRANGTAREALPLVIRGLQARGFEVVAVKEMLRRA